MKTAELHLAASPISTGDGWESVHAPQKYRAAIVNDAGDVLYAQEADSHASATMKAATLMWDPHSIAGVPDGPLFVIVQQRPLPGEVENLVLDGEFL